MKCLFLYYVIVQIFSWAGRWNQSPSTTPQAKKMKCSFLYYIQLLMIGRAGRWTRTLSTSSLKPRNEMLIFELHSTSDDWPGWSLDSNPIHLLSQAKKNEMLIFGLCWTSDSGLGWSMDSNPIHHLSPAKEWNAHFWITFNFWWLAGLVDGLEPHPPPLSSQKNGMLIFGLCSTSDDQPGWSMDSNPIRHPSRAKKMKCSFLDYFQFLVISQAGRWPQTPSTTPLQPKNEMLIFGLRSTSDDQPGWLKDSHPICNLFPTKKIKCSFLYYVQILVISWAGR